MSKYGHRTGDWHEAVINMLGGEEGADRFLRGGITVCEPDRSWREEDGVIYFTVVSDGTTGEDWIKCLEDKGIRLSDYAKSVLRSSDFKPTSGEIYEIAVLKGMLFNDNDRAISKIRAEAEQRKLSTPNVEIACLIREKFTDEEIKAMGLVWIVAMHDPMVDSDGDSDLLGASRLDGGSWLDVFWGSSDGNWFRAIGFAFIVSQVTQS